MFCYCYTAPQPQGSAIVGKQDFFLIYVNFDQKYCTVYFFFFYIYIYIFFFLFYFLAILERKKLALAKYDIIFFFPLASSLGQ